MSEREESNKPARSLDQHSKTTPISDSNHEHSPNPNRSSNQDSRQNQENKPQQDGATAAAKTPKKRCPEDYKFGREIGHGSFSTVHLALDIERQTEVAIKVWTWMWQQLLFVFTGNFVSLRFF